MINVPRNYPPPRPPVAAWPTATRSSHALPGCSRGSVAGHRPAMNAAIPTTYAPQITLFRRCLNAPLKSGKPITLQNECANTGPHRCPVRRNVNVANHPNAVVYANCAPMAASAPTNPKPLRRSSLKWCRCAAPKHIGDRNTTDATVHEPLHANEVATHARNANSSERGATA